MTKTNIKYILWIFVCFLLFILFNSWENDRISNKNQIKNDTTLMKKEDVFNNDNKQDINFLTNNREITIDTDLIFAKINLDGGDISLLQLKKYSKDINNAEGIKLLTNDQTSKLYYSKSNFISNDITNKIYAYSTNKTSYKINKDNLKLIINLKYQLNNELTINKVYVFKNYSYDIDVIFYITNTSNKTIFGRSFGCIGKEYDILQSGWFKTGNYQNTAIYTNDKIYKKLSIDEINKKNYLNTIKGGWLAFVENYFLTTWIPNSNFIYIYSAEKNNKTYLLKYITESEIAIFPQECKSIDTKLFVGPKIKNYLAKLHKGLDLSLDYGIFWPIATSIFLLLMKIFNFINNWGIAIIIITIIIKLMFFNLSSMSYKSLGNMKKLQPKIDILKERYKNDKKEFSQAMLDLYRTEKVNPLSGCLPIIIQIPVFISLYYVLLESVELRHAPFILWINDLSTKDTYYILPIIMCITMFIQQKLNPPIQDPIQKKVMLFMPFIFLLIFIQFPAGLVLYWVVNNILSIIQQWLITRSI